MTFFPLPRSCFICSRWRPWTRLASSFVPQHMKTGWCEGEQAFPRGPPRHVRTGSQGISLPHHSPATSRARRWSANPKARLDRACLFIPRDSFSTTRDIQQLLHSDNKHYLHRRQHRCNQGSVEKSKRPPPAKASVAQAVTGDSASGFAAEPEEACTLCWYVTTQSSYLKKTHRARVLSSMGRLVHPHSHPEETDPSSSNLNRGWSCLLRYLWRLTAR